MSAKRATLSSMTVKAPVPPAAEPAPAAPLTMADPPLADLETPKATTVHMTMSTWRNLRQLAAARDTTMHALLIEGLKMVFEKYGADPGQVLEAKRGKRKD